MASITLGKMRDAKFSWGAQYLWDIRFVSGDTKFKPPDPFLEWFPASSVSFTAFSVENYEGLGSNYAVPLKSEGKSLEITFYDNTKGSLFKWFKEWTNAVYSGTEDTKSSVLPLEEAYAIVEINTLSMDKEILDTYVFQVIPDGELQFQGTSESAPIEYTVSFKIVGEGV